MAFVKGTNQNDTINQHLGATSSADVIIALDGDDFISAAGGDDLIKGGGGADIIDGRSGIDTAAYTMSEEGVFVSLASGAGRGGEAEGDTLINIENLAGSMHADTFWGDNGANMLEGMGGTDTLKGFGGNDALFGGSDNDILYGGEGDDLLDGGEGDDTMSGGEGDDYYFVRDIGDVVNELPGQGVDAVGVVGMSHYVLPEGAEVEALIAGVDTVSVAGNSGNNRIYGHDGFNVLIGGGGRDGLFGYGGADTFFWWSADQTGTTAQTADRIFDFDQAQGDRIHLSNIDANVYAAGDQAFTFIGQAAFPGTPGEINYYHLDGDTYIQMQTGESPDVEGVIRLSGIHAPEASWFVL